MKIYNSKAFASGVFLIVLAALSLAGSIISNKIEGKGVILAAVLFWFGIDTIVRSLSKKKTKEDRMDELDERNRFIELKTQSRSFQLTKKISLVFMLVLIAMGKVSGYEGFIIMGVGMSFSWTISMFTEIFTSLYYEAKN